MNLLPNATCLTSFLVAQTSVCGRSRPYGLKESKIKNTGYPDSLYENSVEFTPKALASCSPGRGPRAGSPRGVGEFPTLGLHKDEGD